MLGIFQKIPNQQPEKTPKKQPKSLDETPYCSLKLLASNKLELTITPNSDGFTFPLVEIDWFFFDETVSAIEPINKTIPKIWRINSPAEVIEINVESLIDRCLDPWILKGRSRFEAVESLKLQCCYSNGRYQWIKQMPDMLTNQLNTRLSEILHAQRAERRRQRYKKIMRFWTKSQ